MQVKDMKCTIGAMVASGKLSTIPGLGRESFDRICDLTVPFDDVERFSVCRGVIGVTDEFEKVIRTFDIPEGELPAGFRPEYVLGDDNSARIDLVRDISYAKNGAKRPTKVLYSVNSADPREVETMKNLMANLTTNPQIIYQNFLDNPKVNVGGKFKDRYEVLEELCRIVGPGVDISVEVNNPFAPENELFEEIAKMEEILTPYRLVVKIPHTGPINGGNIDKLLACKLEKGYDEGDVQENFYGHNLAYRCSEKGYRVNFTLMFDPHQTELALLAKPYFINSFIEGRHLTSLKMKELVEKYDQTGDIGYADKLKQYMIDSDILSFTKQDMASSEAVERARTLLAYRDIYGKEGSDGLDGVRHNLRCLKRSNLPDTRLIVCNMNTEQMYWDLDKMLTEPEFEDMVQRVIVTCTASYFGRFTGAPGILSYQRKFLANAVK